MYRPRSTCCLLLALLAAGPAVRQVAASSLVRGVSPDNIAKYAPKDGKFTCLDGSRTIDFSQVNDNFCDCPDSSDEPGTPACPNGVFYCKNRGHEPKLLATSFVDDGICDCCDGSDEMSGCKNTCIAKNSAKRDELRRRIDDYRASLERRAQYASSAAGVRENIKQRFGAVDGDIEKAEAEVERLAAERKQAEEESEAKREAHKKEQARLAAQRKAEAAARKKAEDEAAEAQAAADKAAAEQQAQQEQQQEGGEGQEEESAEERGRRIAAQWTNDPAAAGPAAAAKQDEAADQKAVKDGGSWSLSGAWSKARDSVKKLATPAPGDAPTPRDEDEEGDAVLPPSPYELEEDGWALHDDPEYEPYDDSAVRTVQSDHDAAERKLSELRAEKERVTRQVTYSFNDAWAGLLSKCLEAREPQFTYRFCFFDKAVQVDNGGGHETSLGLWKGFEKGGTEAVFEGGDYCHKHPARSLRVKVECGGEERAWAASEPSTCAYVAHATTPAACKPQHLQELEDNLAALLAEEAALAKEIEEEERQRQAQLAGMRSKVGGAAHDEL